MREGFAGAVWWSRAECAGAQTNRADAGIVEIRASRGAAVLRPYKGDDAHEWSVQAVEYLRQRVLILPISLGTPVMGSSSPSYSADM